MAQRRQRLLAKNGACGGSLKKVGTKCSLFLVFVVGCLAYSAITQQENSQYNNTLSSQPIIEQRTTTDPVFRNTLNKNHRSSGSSNARQLLEMVQNDSSNNDENSHDEKTTNQHGNNQKHHREEEEERKEAAIKNPQEDEEEEEGCDYDNDIKMQRGESLNESRLRNLRSNAVPLLLCVLVLLYLFVALAIVCDDYFVPALEVMSDEEHLNLSLDVAGATLMASGGSAPELFTNIFGTLKESEVGVGTIVGSAVFNVLFVIGACCLATTSPACCGGSGSSEEEESDNNDSRSSKASPVEEEQQQQQNQPLQCTPWPIVRDCVYYSLSLSVLAYLILDELVNVFDCVVLLSLYVGYVVLMYHNEKVQKWYYSSKGGENNNNHKYEVVKVNEDPNHDLDDDDDDLELSPLPQEDDSSDNDDNEDAIETNNKNDKKEKEEEEGKKEDKEEAEKDKEEEEEDVFQMLYPPIPYYLDDGEHCSVIRILVWGLLFPINFALVFTVPTKESRTKIKWFCCIPLHYLCYVQWLASIFWIGLFSDKIVTYTEEIGRILLVPSVVMGLTLVAVGSSLPDLISSVIVARRGEADMAISSSIGSNVFDVLVGLPLPWLMYNLMKMDEGIVIKSKGVSISIPMLIMTVVLAVLCMRLEQWKLTARLGFVMMVFYVAFVAESIYLEFPSSC